MFLGHYGIALAAKKAAPRASLGTLLLAAQFLDFLGPVFLLLGLEHVRLAPGITRVTPLDFYDYPISHSLIATVGWGIGFAVIYFVLRHYFRGAWIAGLAVLSHWFLDAVVHRPDLPLVPGTSARVGLGLWNSRAATLAIELTLFLVGLALYLNTTEAADRAGRYALWLFVVFLLVIYLGNIFGPPPPSAAYVTWVGLAQWLIFAWAYWIDAHRRAALYQPAAHI